MVVDSVANVSVKSLQDAVLGSIGATYLPDEVISLDQLGLEDFPKTASGKVQKAQLAAVVRDFRARREAEEAGRDAAEEAVLQAWQRAVGIASEHLDRNVPTTMFGDSIAVMRVRDTLRKKLGIVLSPEEMVEHPTIKSQVKLVRTKRPVEITPKSVSVSVGPPSMEDLVLHFGGKHEAEQMKDQVSSALISQWFDWEQDVSSVIQSYDALSILVEAGIIHTWNFAIAITSRVSSVQVR